MLFMILKIFSPKIGIKLAFLTHNAAFYIDTNVNITKMDHYHGFSSKTPKIGENCPTL
jgi:hypothetical protein